MDAWFLLVRLALCYPVYSETNDGNTSRSWLVRPHGCLWLNKEGERQGADGFGNFGSKLLTGDGGGLETGPKLKFDQSMLTLLCVSPNFGRDGWWCADLQVNVNRE